MGLGSQGIKVEANPWNKPWALVWRAVNRFKTTRKRCTAGFSSVDEKSIFSDHIHWPPFPFFNAREADSWGSLPRRGWTAAKGVFDEGFLGLQRKWWKKLYYRTHRCEKIARCKKDRKRGNGGRGEIEGRGGKSKITVSLVPFRTVWWEKICLTIGWRTNRI